MLIFRSLKRIFRLPVLLLLSVSLLSSRLVLAQQTIRVGGTGTGTLLLQRVSYSFATSHPDIAVNVILPPIGSNGALRALSADAIQVAVVAFTTYWPATPDFSRLNEIPWVRTPLVFTGRDIVDSELSINQITKIYSGLITQWPDGKPIRLVTRPERESDTRILRGISPDMDVAVTQALKRTGMPFAENDIANQQLLETNHGSFGAIALGQLLLTDSPLKPVAIDRAPPTAESLQAGRYLFEKHMYLITSKSPTAATLEFIRYLQSKEGLSLVSSYGFIPMSPNSQH